MYDVSSKIGQMFSKMIFDDGYVHCDPHPGNVLVQKDAAGNTQVRPKLFSFKDIIERKCICIGRFMNKSIYKILLYIV